MASYRQMKNQADKFGLYVRLILVVGALIYIAWQAIDLNLNPGKKANKILKQANAIEYVQKNLKIINVTVDTSDSKVMNSIISTMDSYGYDLQDTTSSRTLTKRDELILSFKKKGMN